MLSTLRIPNFVWKKRQIKNGETYIFERRQGNGKITIRGIAYTHQAKLYLRIQTTMAVNLEVDDVKPGDNAELLYVNQKWRLFKDRGGPLHHSTPDLAGVYNIMSLRSDRFTSLRGTFLSSSSWA